MSQVVSALVMLVGKRRKSISDEDVVRGVIRGDEECVEELFVHRCGSAIDYLSKRFGVADLLGQLFLHLWEHDCRRLRTWTGRGPVCAFVRQVAIRICLQRLKESRREVPLEDEDRQNEQTSPAPTELRTEISRALAALDARERAVVILVDIQGVHSPRAAELLQITTQNLYTIHHRARRKLRETISHDF